ncbi:efflux RND transporter permease subunit, partial [candidate division KSB1 bacterium]|nr:efflux RND transporter permease subunit [candidate division KSB1 bacterium]
DITVKIEELKSEFPVGLEILQENEPSLSVRENLDNIKARGVFSLLVVFLILFIFIWNIKVPLIVMTTVGFSVLITIIFFYMFGIGFNVMTIAGLALSIGMLVDSSIVVIDNIFRYREKGLSPAESAEKGAREVFLPITAAVMTTSIVFLPFLYLQGDNKEIFIPMAFAVIFSLISSIIVAFTFIPTYSLKVFPGDSESIRESIEKNRVIVYISGVYGRFIEYVIHHKYWTLGTVLFLFAGSWAIFQYTVPSYSMSGGSQGDSYIRIGVRLPPGSVLERADDIAKSFEEMVIGRENIRKVTTDVFTTRMTVDIRFTDEALDTAFPFLLKDEMTSYGSTFAGVSVTVRGVGDYFSQGGFGGGSAASFRVYINGYNYNKCAEIAEDLGRQFAQIPRVKNVDTNYFGRRDRYDTVLNINRDALGVYDLSVSTVINILDKYVRRNIVSSRSITIDDEIVRYAVKIRDYDTLELEDLKNILITTPGNEQLRLSQIAEFTEQKVTGSIRRADQQYERIVGLEYRGPTQKGREIVQGIIDNQVFPHGYTVKERSQFFNPFTTQEKIYKWLAILFAVVLVYMVTSSLYESLLHPFVIILTVPMALIGVFLIFFAMGKTFNDSAYIGVILLAGIVVNNSIILVDHINLLRRQGLGLYEAVVQGSKDRVRPILMTSATTIMGMMPLIWAGQSRFYDQQIWYSLALASIGGLISATPLTLSVTPVLYILFEEWRSKMKGQWKELGNESIIS